MFLKLISSKALIAQVYRDFRPSNSDWVHDAIEWIGEGLGIIGHGVGYEKRAIPHTIHDHKAKLKCEVDAIELVEYRGHRLPYSSAIHSNSRRDNRSTATTASLNGNVETLIIGDKNVSFRTGEWYTLNPNYINTSFSHGIVTIHADVIPIDDECVPMIPDEPLHKEALSWWVISKMLSRGYKHQTFDYPTAFAKWTYYYPQAQNAGNFPDIGQMEEFTRRWNSVIPLYDLNVRFFDADRGSDETTREAIEPRDNIRTIVHTPELVQVKTGATLFYGATPSSANYPTLLGAVDGTNRTFIVPEGIYAKGKLVVFAPSLELNITEINPSTGTFRFDYSPPVGTSILVQYEKI